MVHATTTMNVAAPSSGGGGCAPSWNKRGWRRSVPSDSGQTGADPVNRLVLVPQRLYIEKSAGGRTEIRLRRDGDDVSVVELR